MTKRGFGIGEDACAPADDIQTAGKRFALKPVSICSLSFPCAHTDVRGDQVFNPCSDPSHHPASQFRGVGETYFGVPYPAPTCAAMAAQGGAEPMSMVSLRPKGKKMPREFVKWGLSADSSQGVQQSPDVSPEPQDCNMDAGTAGEIQGGEHYM